MDGSSVVAELLSVAIDSHLRITALKPPNGSSRRDGRGQPVELGIEGTFHDVGRFLGRLASSPRVMTSSAVSVSAPPIGRSGGIVAGSIVVVAFDLASAASPTDELRAYDDGGRRDPFASLAAPEPAAAAGHVREPSRRARSDSARRCRGPGRRPRRKSNAGNPRDLRPPVVCRPCARPSGGLRRRTTSTHLAFFSFSGMGAVGRFRFTSGSGRRARSIHERPSRDLRDRRHRC